MNEREFKKNHSSDLFTFTRVKSRRKQARTTVGLTINPRLLMEARNRNLDLSRILEQALQSTLEYYPQQNKPESSECLGPGSFLKKEAGPTGIEPAAYGLRVRRSSLTELRAHGNFSRKRTSVKRYRAYGHTPRFSADVLTQGL